jgi:iron complex outermembrane recepter protein
MPPSHLHHPSGHRTLLPTLLGLSLLASTALTQTTPADVAGEVEEYVGFGGEDPNLVLPNMPVEGAFGFSKTLVETPRSVSLISAETIDRMSITAVEDLARVVPGVFTTTRFGIQGGIDVRNVTADTYFRGMRRLSLQGNARSVLAALDSIEVVKGPPSPIFGMGKIGGYTNVTPKSGRARGGKYLEAPEGFFQAIIGSYEKRELSFGIGGPLSIGDRKGGYYLYTLFEDSDSFTDGVPINQEILQSAMSVDDMIFDFRLETGLSYQRSRTAGALATRLTQDLVDRNLYIRGTPLVPLDADGSGMISIRELYQGSPVRGAISGSNMPLIQTFRWPVDPVTGQLIPLGQFPVVPGIPQAMYDYLVANPDKDPTGLLRAQGVGGPLPNSGLLPVGFVLDPTTVGYGEYIQNRSASFEKEVDARLYTAYVDLINDQNPDFTLKNQLFFDMMDQHKFSNQPVTRINDVFVVEDKVTATRRLQRLPDWLEINGLASLNFRYTESQIKGFGGDYGSSRSDILASTWMPELGGMTPNSSFVTPFENSDYSAGGTPFTNSSSTRFTETGLGLMFDIDVARKTNLLIGARGDVSTAKTNNHGGIYAFGGAGTSNANPMRQVANGSSAKGTDRGISWSASLSHELPFGLHPYATIARSSVALDGASNEISTAIINGGHMGEGDIKELGLKSNLLDGRLFLSVAGYEQRRTDVKADDDDPALIGAFASSTETEGVEIEIKWAPTAAFFATAYFLKQESTFTPNRGTGQLVDGRVLGFQDIIDPITGAVIFPAEAFLYGGRAQLTLPNNVEGYDKKAGNPETQIGASSGYTFKNRVGLTLSANYLSAVDSGRLGLVRLPSTIISNAGLSYSRGSWDFKVDVFNIADERYFKARTGDNTADYYIQAMPGRRWQANVRYRF